jgi:hypothetical protein
VSPTGRATRYDRSRFPGAWRSTELAVAVPPPSIGSCLRPTARTRGCRPSRFRQPSKCLTRSRGSWSAYTPVLTDTLPIGQSPPPACAREQTSALVCHIHALRRLFAPDMLAISTGVWRSSTSQASIHHVLDVALVGRPDRSQVAGRVVRVLRDLPRRATLRRLLWVASNPDPLRASQSQGKLRREPSFRTHRDASSRTTGGNRAGG